MSIELHSSEEGSGSSDPLGDSAGPPRPAVLVWDVAIRLFHWSLVASVLIAWSTGGSGNRIHEIAGSAVASLLIFRLIWGLTGTQYARFTDFVRSPRDIAQYLGDVVHNRAARHIGHNPAGALMIMLMMVLLTVIVTTGFMQLTNRFYGLAWVEDVHNYAANGLMLMVPLHLLGVIMSSWMHQENLVGAMFQGDKPIDTVKSRSGLAIPSSEERLLARLQASQGMSTLLFLLAGGIASGIMLTSGRQAPQVATDASPPAVSTAAATATPAASPAGGAVASNIVTPAAAAGSALPVVVAQSSDTPVPAPGAETGGLSTPTSLSRAVQDAAVAMSKDRQDYIAGGPEDMSISWLLSSGGRLYDNWFQALGLPGPQTTHPVWPSANTNLSGAQTWRCKNCHGWDYLGRDGQYRSGPNATGYVGVQRFRGRDPAVIMSILGNSTHQMSDDILPPHAKYRLAAFISRGQHDAAKYVVPGRVKGDIALGKPLFQNLCAACHGFDGRGRKLAGSNDRGPQFVGTKARNGPIEVLHKLRNGHPGAIMVSMRPFSMDVAANLLAYAQTLPDR